MTEKQRRNQMHYQANKNRILERAKRRYELQRAKGEGDAPEFSFASFLPSTPFLTNDRRFTGRLGVSRATLSFIRQDLSMLWLGTLVFLLTTLLLRDSIKFFVGEGEGTEALFRAFAIEASTVTLSILTCKPWPGWIKQRGLQWLLMAFSLWLACAPTLNHGWSEYTNAKEAKVRIAKLENEASRLRQQQDDYFRRSWITAGRKLDTQIQAVDSERQALVGLKIQEPLVLLNTLIVCLAYRVLILLANVFFSARFAEKLNQRLKNRAEKNLRDSEKIYWLKTQTEKLRANSEKSGILKPEGRYQHGATENSEEFSQSSLFDLIELKNRMAH